MSAVLVTGFGPFPGVTDNPTAALAREVDGALVDGHRICGRVLPVSYARGPRAAIDAARELDAALVVGLGVAMRRERVAVEVRAVRRCVGSDVDGCCPDAPGDGPDEVPATLDVHTLASALDADLSQDAGRYVCNAWLYRVTTALEVPVGFVHVPVTGMAAARLLGGIGALLAGRRST